MVRNHMNAHFLHGSESTDPALVQRIHRCFFEWPRNQCSTVAMQKFEALRVARLLVLLSNRLVIADKLLLNGCGKSSWGCRLPSAAEIVSADIPGRLPGNHRNRGIRRNLPSAAALFAHAIAGPTAKLGVGREGGAQTGKIAARSYRRTAGGGSVIIRRCVSLGVGYSFRLK